MRRAVGFAAAVMCCAAVFGLGACATASVQEDLVVVESGYWKYEDDSASCFYYAVVVENPSTGYGAEQFRVVVTGKDSEGNIVGEQPVYGSALFGNGKTALCGTIYGFESAETLEFDVDNSSFFTSFFMWNKSDTKQYVVDATIYADGVYETTDGYGATSVFGEITNLFYGELPLARVNVLFRTSDGSVVGGAANFVDSIAAGETIPFSVENIYGVPEHASVEVYIDYGRVAGSPDDIANPKTSLPSAR